MPHDADTGGGAHGLRRRAVSGTKWSAVGQGISIVLTFGRLAILSRILRPSDFGLMAMTVVVVTLGQFLSDAGFSAVIVQRKEITREQVSTLYWLNVLAGLIVLALFVGCVPLIMMYFGEPELLPVLLWSAPVFLVYAFGQQPRFLLRREMRFSSLALVDVGVAIVSTVAGVLLALDGAGVLSLVWSNLLGVVVATLALNVLVWPRWRPLLRFRWSDISEFVSFGLFQLGERLVAYWGWQWDKIIIGRILGSKVLGIYSLGYRLALFPLQTINPVFNQVTFPVFSRIQDDDRALRRGYLFVIRTLSLVMMPIYAGMIATGDLIVVVLLGEQWAASGPVLRILAGLGFLYTSGNPFGNLLLAKGRADLGFYLNLLVLVVYGVAAWIGSGFGATGVAWALLIVQFTLLFPVGCYLRYVVVGMTVGEFLGAVAPYLALSFLMIGELLFLRSLVSLGSSVELALCVSAGAVFYGALVLLFQRDFVALVIKTIRNRE